MLNKLSLKAPSKILGRRHSNFLFIFQRKQVDISCESDDSHEMSRLVFSEKFKKKKMSAAVVIGTLRVKMPCSLLIFSQSDYLIQVVDTNTK